MNFDLVLITVRAVWLVLLQASLENGQYVYLYPSHDAMPIFRKHGNVSEITYLSAITLFPLFLGNERTPSHSFTPWLVTVHVAIVRFKDILQRHLDFEVGDEM